MTRGHMVTQQKPPPHTPPPTMIEVRALNFIPGIIQRFLPSSMRVDFCKLMFVWALSHFSTRKKSTLTRLKIMTLAIIVPRSKSYAIGGAGCSKCIRVLYYSFIFQLNVQQYSAHRHNHRRTQPFGTRQCFSSGGSPVYVTSMTSINRTIM